MIIDNLILASYWFAFGTFILILLTWQDFRTMLIDDRRNFFMMGVTISLITHINTSLWKLLFLMAFVVSINILFSRLYGRGDISIIAWTAYGYGIISFTLLGVYLMTIAAFTAIYHLFKVYFLSIDKRVKTPFTFVLTLAYAQTAILAYVLYF